MKVGTNNVFTGAKILAESIGRNVRVTPSATYVEREQLPDAYVFNGFLLFVGEHSFLVKVASTERLLQFADVVEVTL